MSDLEFLYKDLLDKGRFEYDKSQNNAIKALNELRSKILKPIKKKTITNFIRSYKFNLFLKKNKYSNSGVYLYGGVGTGKTMIMNLFFHSLKISEKRRVHFHEFMHEFHQKTKKIRSTKNKDPVKIICKDLAKEIKVLCFDEFQIVDITDAMIVGRLFEELMKNEVTIITTSNYKPHELYKDGLNRQLFVPFIIYIENNLKILEVDNCVDYRKNKLKFQDRFFLKKNPKDLIKFNKLWEDLYDNNSTDFIIHFQSRELKLKKFSNGICRVSFQELCEKPLSTVDYLNLCAYVKVLFLENIPQISKSQNDIARRFIHLIDILYEARIQLICFSNVTIQEIYNGAKLDKEFMRTISRLNEMISRDWIIRDH